MPRIDPNARTNVLKPRKVRKAKPAPKPAVTRAPVTDIQSSGSKHGYGGSQKTAVREQARRVRLTHKSDHASDQNRQPTPIPKNEIAKVDPGGHTLTVKTGPRKGLVVSSEQYKRLGATGVGNYRSLSARTGAQKFKEDSVVAPALKILDQTTRPVHAIAAGTDAAITGKSIKTALVRGIKNKDKTTFGTVLKHAGAPKIVRNVGGFALDVGLDPTTYVTFGTGAVAKKAAVDAAEKTAAEAAARKGVTVKFAGKQVPGVTAATAKIGHGAAAVGHKAATKPGGRTVARAGASVKNAARDVRPSVAPAGADKASFQAGRQTARKARATANRAQSVAERQARGLRGRLDALHRKHGTSDAQIAHALDTNSVDHLPSAAHAEVRDIQARFAELKKEREAAGVREGTIQTGYYPHAREDALHAKLGIVADDSVSVGNAGTKRAGPAVNSSKARRDLRPVAEQNAERVAQGKSPFSTDVPLVYANYAKDTGRLVAENRAFRDLADTGRVYHEGDALKPNESVFHLGYDSADKLGLRPYKEGTKLAKGDRLVVLDTKTVDTVLARMKPARAESHIGQKFDKVTGTWKAIATFSPGFHIRNAMGDTQMAYLAQPGHKLVGNTRKALKVNRVAVDQVKAERKSLTNLAPDAGGKIKIAGKQTDVAEVLRLAQEHGVVDSGKITREFRDLIEGGGGQKRVKRTGTKVSQYAARKTGGRENVTRLSTFIHGLDKGMKPAEAADLSLSTHIDYGDLTDLERKVLRRAMPFYTFSARSIPLHAKALVTNPGKFATIQKLREEAANAAGLPSGYESGQSEYQQRNASIPVRLAGGSVKLLSGGLPAASSLNELPTGISPKYAGELVNFTASQVNAIPKGIAEFALNYSTFFRDQIQDPSAPRVAAPSAVMHLPDGLKKALGVQLIRDAKTGKMVPGWYAKVDYAAKSIPGLPSQVQQLASPGTNRRGQGTTGKVVSALGVKVDNYDPIKQARADAYKKLTDAQNQLSSLNRQGVPVGKNGYFTRQHDALSRKVKDAQAVVDEANKAMKVPVKVKGKTRPLTTQQQIAKEIADYRKDSSPSEAKKKVLEEIAKYKMQNGGG